MDLEDHEIQKFLQAKLVEVKLNNDSLEKAISKREAVLEELSGTAHNEMEQDSLTITLKWKRLHQSKYIIGFELRPLNRYSNYKAILSWDSSDSLSYQQFLASEKGRLIGPSNKEANYLIVALQLPKFLEKLKYELSGFVRFCEEGKNQIAVLPKVELTAEDICNHNLFQPWMISKCEDLICSIVASRSFKLMISFPEDWTSSIEDTFQIHLSLIKVEFGESYFLAKNVSEILDGSLILVGEKLDNLILEIEVFVRCFEKLVALLHHIHSRIPQVVVLPRSSLDKYVKNYTQSSLSAVREKLRNSMLKECEVLNNIQMIDSLNCEDYIRLKSQLAEFEMLSDSEYVKLLDSSGLHS